MQELVIRCYLVTLALLPLAWVEWNKQMMSVEVLGFLFRGVISRVLSLAFVLPSALVYGLFAYST